MPRSLQSHGKRSRVYVPVLLYIFKQKYSPEAEVIEFTLKDVAEACSALGITAANPPDIIYRMKSRTIIPEEIQVLGFRVIRPEDEEDTYLKKLTVP